MTNKIPKWYATQDIRDHAHTATTAAIKIGLIGRQSCEKCGDARSYAHHDDYTKPLQVRWLCFHHHAKFHANFMPIGLESNLIAGRGKRFTERGPEYYELIGPRQINDPMVCSDPATWGEQ